MAARKKKKDIPGWLPLLDYINKHKESAPAPEPASAPAPEPAAEPASEPTPKRAAPASSINYPGLYGWTLPDRGDETYGEMFQRSMKAMRALKLAREGHADEKSLEDLSFYAGFNGFDRIYNNRRDNLVYRDLAAAVRPIFGQKSRQLLKAPLLIDKRICDAVWKGLEKAGVSAPMRALDSSCGIGAFAAACPIPDLSFVLSDQNPVNREIAKLLHPNVKVFNFAFESLNAPAVFDLAVSAPFRGAHAPHDANFPHLSNFPAHSYQLLKSLELLREGGLGVFVMPRWFMDGASAKSRECREFAASKAELASLMRVSSLAGDYAAIPCDVLVFKRTDSPSQKYEWIESVRDSWDSGYSWEKMNANVIFRDHPEFCAGLMTLGDDKIKGHEMRVEASAEKSREALEIFLENFPAIEKSRTFVHVPESIIPDSSYFRNLPDESLFIHDGKLMMKTIDWLGEPCGREMPDFSDMRLARAKSLIALRDALSTQIAAEKSDSPDIESLRQKLNEAYDSHVDKFGFVSSRSNALAFRMDASWALLSGLEDNYDPGDAEFPERADKAPIFFKRAFWPAFESGPENAEAALRLSLSATGRVDAALISRIAPEGAKAMDILRDKKLVFMNPESWEWETRGKYLSGNVREKINTAEEAGFSDNAEELKKVLPPDIPASDICVSFGATWIPGRIYDDFIRYLSDYANVEIRHMKDTGDWSVALKVNNSNLDYSVYGTGNCPMEKIVPALLEGRSVIVRDGRGKIDADETMAAAGKAEKLKAEFASWIWRNEDRRNELVRIYNETFNSFVPPAYDGSFMDFPGMSGEISLRPHQKNAVWRACQEGRCLFDHAVGSGKTMIAIASIMEMKRMGFAKKSLVVAQASTLPHWGREFRRLYPDARVMIVDPESMHAGKRKETLERMVMGGWDAVIMADSSFSSISAPLAFLRDMYKSERARLSDLRRLHEDPNREKGFAATFKKAIENLDANIAQISAELEKPGRESDFADLGFDNLFVDESHEFKNLRFSSRMDAQGLGNSQGSDKAWDLFQKCRYLQKTRGRGVFFMTGTPISNSISELYSIQRYMDFDSLRSAGISFFDQWASTFAKVSSDWELDPTGTGYRMAQRLSKFGNIPELSAMYRSFADVVTDDDLKDSELAKHIPKLKGGGPIRAVAKRSPEQAEYMNDLVRRMENMPFDARIDNPLNATNDARKAALDMRLIDPGAPDFEGSKVNLAADNIAEIYKETPAGTQLVFCDLSVPAKKRKDIDENMGMDDWLAASSSFSVYDDLKAKLVKRGIPENEIAFVHDAAGQEARKRLFDAVNAGKIRVLFGSTKKLGTGVNIQRRAKAAHHLDATWRQSDIEQRNGRIIRQGNILHDNDPDFEVQVFYYATELTLDARMWQILEAKAASVARFRKGLETGREMDDIDGAALTASEMKAEASGDPLVHEEIRLKSEIAKLSAMQKEWMRASSALQESVADLSKWNERLSLAEKKHDAARKLASGNKPSASMIYEGKTLSGEDVFRHINDAVKSEISEPGMGGSYMGDYRGLQVYCSFMSKKVMVHLELKGHGSYWPKSCEINPDAVNPEALFRKIDAFLEKGIDKELENAREKAAHEKASLETALARKNLPFEHEDELREKREKYGRVVAALYEKTKKARADLKQEY